MSKEQITLFFSKLEARLQELPTVVGKEVVNYSLESFEKQSWGNDPWKARKSKKDASRAILVKSGRLRRSIRIVASTPSSVTVGTDVLYAAVHNEGGLISRAARSETFKRNRYAKGPKKGAFRKGITTGTGIRGITFGAYSYRMPQRRFLGMTPELKRRIKERVISELKGNSK